ncbi:MAG: hypothetical protein U1D28_01720 [Burkholderiales bacterium]|nr:hypothetical protein [Burkholderiales bacterium]
MLFVLLYLVGATAVLALFPHWSTATALLLPLAVVASHRLALFLMPKQQKAPGGVSTTGGREHG